jgi:hypothetical protein
MEGSGHGTISGYKSDISLEELRKNTKHPVRIVNLSGPFELTTSSIRSNQ